MTRSESRRGNPVTPESQTTEEEEESITEEEEVEEEEEEEPLAVSLNIGEQQ